jgi:Rrf2 family cysteine metabolism transcriptional repressor
MKISKKCQYALRAVFELAARNREIPIKAREIAHSQRISTKFLEIILNDLKHAGFIESIRGNEGGYRLSSEPKDVTVEEIIESIEGTVAVRPTGRERFQSVSCFGDVAFDHLWREATNAISQVFGSTTFADLVEVEQRHKYKSMPSYCI